MTPRRRGTRNRCRRARRLGPEDSTGSQLVKVRDAAPASVLLRSAWEARTLRAESWGRSQRGGGQSRDHRMGSASARRTLGSGLERDQLLSDEAGQMRRVGAVGRSGTTQDGLTSLSLTP
jgi:hypothetical protein